MRRVVILLVLLVSSLSLSAQSFFTPGAWKKYRKEWQFSFGASNCLTDLGGKDQIGTNFLKDWEINATRYCARGAFAYYLNPTWIYRSQFNFGMIKGDDALTQEPFRHNRNLNFRSIIVEFNQNIQFLFLKEKMGNRYGLKNIKGRKIGAKSMSIGMYLTAGIGVFYFNPQGRYNGTYVSLQQYHTEGQGLPGGPKQYKRISFDVPVGFGLRKALSRQWGMYMEFTQHYTFTDYLDDVSSVYYDPAALTAAYGAPSGTLSDPNLGNFVDGAGISYATKPGEQRGDVTDRDNYMFLTVGAFYKVRTNVNGGRGKRKKIKALF